MIRCIVVANTLLLVSSVFAQLHPAPAETDVREALAKFIRAFDDLDWEHFRLTFDDNATVFYPRAMPQRANGRAEFEKAFKRFFTENSGLQLGITVSAFPSSSHSDSGEVCVFEA